MQLAVELAGKAMKYKLLTFLLTFYFVFGYHKAKQAFQNVLKLFS